MARSLSCAETKTDEYTGEYIDNSVSSRTKVKTAILQEPSLKTLQISVKTYKDNGPQLSGFVDSELTAKGGRARSPRESLASPA